MKRSKTSLYRILCNKTVFALALTPQIIPAATAMAQTTVVNKTATGTPLSAFLSGMGALQAVPASCPASETGPAACSSATAGEILARRVTGSAAASETVAGLQVLLSQGALTAEPAPGPQTQAGMEQLFQLSDKLEWRIEAGEAEAANLVGVFASRTLWQKGDNMSVKLDTGVNVETKTGSTTGVAGFAVAW
jgi:hypothetical protein